MPLITLTSDIGAQDYLVGAVKGRLLQANPSSTIVDITHQLPPFNYPQAAYVCRNAIRNFPEGSFHLVLVNLFDSRPDNLIIALHKQQYIACANNGLLTMILEEKPEEFVGITLDKNQHRHTLYFAELLGKCINALHSGASLENIGDQNVELREKNPLKPLMGADWIEGQIIFIDHFENVIVNITREQFEEQRKGRNFRIVFKRDEIIDKISESYADVPESEKLALFNAAGYLEIAINKGNAAGLFGLQGFAEQYQNSTYLQNRLFYQTVKIYFV
ncbi:MAG TPA: SAM-dependent chlorinase/fluorinase [Parasegetibacter sp.]